MEILFDNDYFQYQIEVFPQHRRTIKFFNYDITEYKLVEIPASLALVVYNKEYGYLTNHSIYDINLDYNLDFGYSVCSNGLVFKNISEYVSWYWNSVFINCRNHSSFSIREFRKCYSVFHKLAEKYNPNKLIQWKQDDIRHISCCSICKSSLTFKERWRYKVFL